MTANRLRVLVATPRYFPDLGGIETHVYETTRRLAAAGVEVTVLTTDRTGDRPARQLADGVHIRRVRAWPAQRDYYFAPSLSRVILAGPWDVIHCQGVHTLVAPLTMLAALRAHLPYVVSFHSGGHSSRLRRSFRPMQWRLLHPLLARARWLVAVSAFEAAYFRQQLRLPSARFVVIPNGASSFAETSRPMYGVDPGLIVSVGRLERYKGHHRVLEALPLVLAHRPDVRLRIVGEGPYELTMRRRARELGVADRVDIGAVPPADREGMAAVLARASLVTLLSEYEAHPIAIMEALALRRPVLVAETSGLRELAEAGLARAIPRRSTINDIAQAILRQLDQPLVPCGAALPSWDHCASGLLALYQAIRENLPCAC